MTTGAAELFGTVEHPRFSYAICLHSEPACFVLHAAHLSMTSYRAGRRLASGSGAETAASTTDRQENCCRGSSIDAARPAQETGGHHIHMHMCVCVFKPCLQALCRIGCRAQRTCGSRTAGGEILGQFRQSRCTSQRTGTVERVSQRMGRVERVSSPAGPSATSKPNSRCASVGPVAAPSCSTEDYRHSNLS
jgi:hypothetical protein